MIQLHIYGILVILELLLVVSAVSLFLFVRNRGNRRRIARLQNQLSRARSRSEAGESANRGQAGGESAPVQSYADFLKDELDSSSVMLGDDPGGDGDDQTPEAGDESSRLRSMLAARHQFLQLELDAQAMGKDPQSKRRHIVESMEGLLATLSGLQQEAAPAAEEEGAAEQTEDAATLAKEKQLESQIAHLREVIDNQHEVMRELRELLEKEAGQSEELQTLVRKLQDAEAQSVELSRSLEFMEKEAGNAAAQGGGWQSQYESVPDADMLRDLVGNQQQTITKLQSMLKANIADDSATTELRDAMEKIQRSNQELGTCVMVLEDENTMLRDQIDSLRSQLEGLDSGDDDDPVSREEVGEAIAALPDEAVPAEGGEDRAAGGGEAADAEAVPAAGEEESAAAGESEPPIEENTEPTDAGPAGSAADTGADGDARVDAGGEDTEATAAVSEPVTASSADAEPAADTLADTPDADETETAASASTPPEADAAGTEEGDDIDAILNSVQTDQAPSSGEQEAAESAESAQEEDEINTLQNVGLGADDDELSDDDIDALLNGTNDKKAE